MNARIIDVLLNEKADEEYYDYGVATIEDRAIAGTLDGLKPVTRRALWATYKSGAHSRAKHIKSAKVVGTVIGDYHPHGDVSAYDAIVTAAQAIQPMIDGAGNWGTPLDDAAAYRYCFAGDTRVMTERGLLSFEELCAMSNTSLEARAETPFEILVASKDKPQTTSHVVNSGFQNTVKVKTSQGYSVTCTPNEPFLILTGNGFVWKDAQDLTKNDWVCLKRDNGLRRSGTNTYKGIKITKKLAKLLGYLVGDGYYNNGQNYIGFNQVSDDTFNDFVHCWEAVFGNNYRVGVKQPNSYGKSEYNQFYSAHKPDRVFLATLGFEQGNSYDRRVPDCIWHCDAKIVAAFLEALYESDGSVAKTNRSSSHVSLHSVSRQLLSEVSLLLRAYFGIFTSSITRESKKGTSLRLSFFGTENLLRFVTRIGFYTERGIIINPNGKSNQDCIPAAYTLGVSSGKEYDYTQRATFRKKFLEGKFNSSKQIKLLKRIFDRDYYFDRVRSIKKAAKQFVYDLCVPTSHSFTANGFVVHNTNMRLSPYSDAIFFDPFYMNAIRTIPNFDGSNVEPLNLVTLLPHLLVTGNFGIATGVKAAVPSFTVDSLLKVIKLGLTREITVQDCVKHLVFTSANGATVDPKHPLNKNELAPLFKTGKGKVYFQCEVLDTKDGFRFNQLPPIGITGAIDKIAALPAVGVITDDSDLNDIYPLAYRVVLKKGTSQVAADATRKKIETILGCVIHFDTKVTDRDMSKEGEAEVSLRSAKVTDVLNEWIDYRLALESLACKFHMGKLDEKIARIDLLRLAIKHIDFILGLLKARGLTDEQMIQKLVARLKITAEDANAILDFRIRQLKALEDKKLVEQRKELVKEKAGLNERRKNPEPYVATTLPGLAKMAHDNFYAKIEQVRMRLKAAKKKAK